MEITLAGTNYLGVSGTNAEARDGLLIRNQRQRLSSIRDGSSNTLLVGERGFRLNALDHIDDSEDLTNLRYGFWFAPPGQRHGSAAVVLGSRELNFAHFPPPGNYLEWERNCPPGAYHFQRPGMIRDQTGQLQDACDLFHFWSYHTGGANFCFADGSVRFLSYEADAILPELSTRAGGEVVTVP